MYVNLEQSKGDQIGRVWAIWAIFLALVEFFLQKTSNGLGEILAEKKTPKI
jgi:hypothetical protein